MKPRLLLCVALAVAGLGCAHASRTQAESAAAAWTAQHTEGLLVEVYGATSNEGFEPAQESGACVNDLFRLRAQSSAAEVDLFFNCPQNEVPDLEWLRANLRSYNLARLPLSIEAAGWAFQASAPSATLQSGLTFESWTDGLVELRIETQLMAVEGKDRTAGCKAKTADGENPDCFVNVPYEAPLVLYMGVPLASSAFRAWAVPARK
jgi:hypothetical protein